MKKEVRTDITMIAEMHSNMLYRICFILLENGQDVQEVLLAIFMHYIEKAPAFEKEVQRKAWLIQTAYFLCRKFSMKKNGVGYEMHKNNSTQGIQEMTLTTFLNLSRKYKTVLFLYFVQGYESKEIAVILKTTKHAIGRKIQKSIKLFQISEIVMKANIEEILADVKISENMRDSIIWCYPAFYLVPNSTSFNQIKRGTA